MKSYKEMETSELNQQLRLKARQITELQDDLLIINFWLHERMTTEIEQVSNINKLTGNKAKERKSNNNLKELDV